DWVKVGDDPLLFGAGGPYTVDMTDLTVPVYNFTLKGGENQDIVIADDASVNSFSKLDFGGNKSGYVLITDPTDLAQIEADLGDDFDAEANYYTQSDEPVEDILRIVDGATVREEDLENVTGL